MVEFITTCDPLSKLKILFNFGNLINSIILPPPFSAQEKISSENAAWEEWAIPVCLVDNDKNMGESFAWGHE